MLIITCAPQTSGETYIVVYDQRNPLNRDRIQVIVSTPERASFARGPRETAVGQRLGVELLFEDKELRRTPDSSRVCC